MKKIFIYFLTLLFTLTSIFPNESNQNTLKNKVVKVGYYIDSPPFMSGFSEKDPKEGYGYEYLQNLAIYTGWQYEYVYGEWADLYEKLLNGEIDILTDVSYLKERESLLFYPKYPMGSETYYLYARNQNDIFSDSYDSLNGKTLCIDKTTYHYKILQDWLKDKNITLNMTFKDFTNVSEEDFNKGIFDLFVSMDSVAEPHWEPLFKLGKSDIYIAISKNKPELLEELNNAQETIFTLNPNYNYKLWIRYYSNQTNTRRLSKKELNWFENHNEITIGGLYNDFPFFDKNKNSENAIGLIEDFVKNFYEIFNVDVKISYKFYQNYSELEEALKSKEIDLIFPYIFDLYQAETNGFIVSKPFMNLEYSYIYKNSPIIKTISAMPGLRSSIYCKKTFPNVKIIDCNTPEKCLDKIITEEVSGTIFNNYRFQDSSLKKKRFRNLNILPLPKKNALSFCARREDYCLVSSINKLINISLENEELDISKSLVKYAIENKFTFSNFFDEYKEIIIGFIILFAVLVITLFTTLEKLKLVINYDVLTHLLNRRKLQSYLNNAILKAKNKGEEFSILIFDLDNFKSINDTYGHSCGDEVLKMAANTISKGIKRKDFAFRWGGEEFLVLMFAKREIVIKAANRIKEEISRQVVECGDKQISITTTIGISTYKDGENQKSLFQTADKNLYIGKNSGKNKVVS